MASAARFRASARVPSAGTTAVRLYREVQVRTYTLALLWEFPKIRDTLFWGPYNEGPTI